MRILVLTHYFPPETGGPQNRLASLATGLRDAGHDVTVITAKPNYPTGVVFDGYKSGWLVESVYEGIRVLHTWIVTDEKKTAARRILYYLSFMISSVLTSLRVKEDVDLVLASSPPLSVGLSGWAVSRLKGARYVFDIRDLWPDVAVAMGELTEGWMAAAARAAERFIYRKADGITAVTEAFCRNVRERTGDKTPVVRVSNGTVPEVFRVDQTKSELRKELRLPNGFLALYAGNLGLAQGLRHLVEAAEMLREDKPEARIGMLGDGALRDELESEARDRGLGNLFFRDRVELREAARYMAASDALLVPLGDHPIYRKFIPSKLFDAMAAARPVLLAVDGEARDLLEEAGAGLYYPAEDAGGLVRAIRTLIADGRAEEMGRRGRAFVEARFTRETQAREMARFLEEVVRRRRPREQEESHER